MQKIYQDLKFPEGFLWGAATSAYQVEGDNINDWSEWEKSEKRIKYLKERGLTEKYGIENYISGKTCGHYDLFEKDFEMAKSLGHNVARFSIEWSRIEPKEGEFNEKELEHYKKVVKCLKNLGLEPIISLWHWPIPLWLESRGGWRTRGIEKYFTRYAEKVVKFLGDDVRFWITLNEPEIYASNSYLKGIWPPQKINIFSYFYVLNNLVKAHNQSYDIIKKINPFGQIGIAKNNIYFEAYRNKLINKLLRVFINWWWNFYFLNRISKKQDFIGLNHYFHNKINFGFNKNDNKVISDMGWELLPEAIYHVLIALKKYKKPIYITENGLADINDEKRPWFIVETLKNVHKAIIDGADVRGYLYWSLLDNFEWDKGFWPRFGLIAVNYKTLERRARDSAYIYRDICLANEISNDMLKKYSNY